MSYGFSVEIEAAATAAPRIGAIDYDLLDALTDLRATLADCAGMCGDDSEGREFPPPSRCSGT